MIRNPLLKATLIIIFSLLVSCDGPVKEPSVAGGFYPAGPEELRQMVGKLLSGTQAVPHGGRLVALVSPHAGYVYSGAVAAQGYKNIGDKDLVILIGPSHYASFAGASVYAEGSFKTPLGLVKIDERAARRLIDEKAGVRFLPEAYEKEHSIEVQLPFLQSSLKGFRVVPVLMGSPTQESFDRLATGIAGILRENERAVVVASTDLSHYMDYESTLARDRKTIEALRRLSLSECQRLMATGEGEMCGAMPVLLALEAARRLGANEAVLFGYSNSARATGDLSRVVGYASVGIYKSPLTEDDKRELLNLAREAIARKVKAGDSSLAGTANPRLQADAAVFVTIKRGGSLRGCIGQTSPTMPLHLAVQWSAMRSCAADPRFPPMTEAELRDMEIEISILSTFEPVADPMREVVVGRDGLFLRKGTSAGLLLPQVPVSEGWDKATYLSQLSLKAGLPEDAWREGASIHRFTAEVFGEGR